MPVVIFFLFKLSRDQKRPLILTQPGICILPPPGPWHHSTFSFPPGQLEATDPWGRFPPLSWPVGSPHSSFKGMPEGEGSTFPQSSQLVIPNEKSKHRSLGPMTHRYSVTAVFQALWTPGMFCRTLSMPQSFVRGCSVGEMEWRQAEAESAALPPSCLPPEQLCFYLLPTEVSLSDFVLKKNSNHHSEV